VWWEGELQKDSEEIIPLSKAGGRGWKSSQKPICCFGNAQIWKKRRPGKERCHLGVGERDFKEVRKDLDNNNMLYWVTSTEEASGGQDIGTAQPIFFPQR
jgi:hypothetical protein